MNLKEKLTHVFSLLGLTQKAKDQSLTDEEWKTVVNRFQHLLGHILPHLIVIMSRQREEQTLQIGGNRSSRK